jgi:hypothetical protein
LSEDLISFDNLDEYDEFKDYTDPVFSDDIMQVFIGKDNTDERMTVLDVIMLDIQAERVAYLPDFSKQVDFISLTSSRINIGNLMDDDHGSESLFSEICRFWT